MDRWMSRMGTGLYFRTATRRGALGWLGRASASVVAVTVALATSRPARAEHGPQGQGSVRPAPSMLTLLPRGQQAPLPTDCNTCSPYAEYVCSNCCVGNTCCSGNLYREPCYDANCNLYYTYWCA